MKSDGTRRAIIIAVLCLFSIAMLFMTASAWGLKAFARFAEFMTGDRIFLRILAGIGFGGLSAAGVFALVCTAKIGRTGNSKSSLNMLSGEPNGTTYISSSAVDGLVQNCVKKVASIKSCVSTISAADGQINIDLRLVVFQDESLPTLCAALQRDVKSYIENATGIPVSNVLVAIVDVAAPRDDGKAGNRRVK